MTFKVQNGTWSDHLSADKNVTVDLRNGFGTLSENDVPTGMIPTADTSSGAGQPPEHEHRRHQ
ncbi:MAG: hypothetical protein ACLS69_02165 [Butyricicoccus sp.]